MKKGYIMMALVLALGATIAWKGWSTDAAATSMMALNNAANEASSAEREFASLNAAPLKLPLITPRIVVEKSRRRLTLYSNGKAVRVRTVGLGLQPRGDKVKEGDRKTPEGKFRICQKNPNSQYYLSLALNYPTVEDAQRGLRTHLITRDDYDKIVQAHRDSTCPPWSTSLGGEVFIHGHGSQRDWTWGCIALNDDAMKELFDAVPVGTVVIVKP